MLPTIVMGQVLVTSTWFAANAVVDDIGKLWPQRESTGYVTLAVQLGFIAGTLLAAFTGISDRMSGRRLFFLSAQLAALTNWAIVLWPANLNFVMACRFLTGIALAGVYPVGMKIAASWYAEGLGRALGFLVGALVLGTSSTHLMRAFQVGANWQYVIGLSTLAAIVGGLLVCLVTDGPHLRRSASHVFDIKQVVSALADRHFRAAAFGYFGHMWELYAFWAFMPRWIHSLELGTTGTAVACFAVIAIGMVGCVVGGLVAQHRGSRRVARFYLAISCACCLLSPIVYGSSAMVVLPFMLLWGLAVVGDSPQLSSLNALTAPRAVVGSALTATTCIGFSITVVSLFWLDWLVPRVDPRYLFISLAIGPMIGLWSLRPMKSGD